MRRHLIALAAAAVMATGAGIASVGEAGAETLDRAASQALGAAEAEFMRHTREHRMWEIQRNLERQQRGGGGGYRDRGYDRPRDYDRPRGYGRRDDGYGRRGYDRPRRYYYD
jgi:hypothetical protein